MQHNSSFAVAMAILLSAGTYAAYGQTASERYTVQERCGKRAEEVFKRDYSPNTQNTAEGQWTFSYENHYNERLNKCFVLYTGTLTSPGIFRTQLTLTDINENRESGQYIAATKARPLVHCIVGEARCSSEVEWRRLAKPFMEE